MAEFIVIWEVEYYDDDVSDTTEVINQKYDEIKWKL